MTSYQIGFPHRSDFEQFKTLQAEILPDVQPFDLDHFTKLVDNNEVMICRDETTDNVVAFVVVKDEGEIGYLRQLAVEEDHRREGLATKLIIAAHNWFEKRGLSKVKVFVKSHNQPALELYEQLNYNVVAKLYQYLIDWDEYSLGVVDDSIRELEPVEDELVAKNYPDLGMTLLSNYRTHPTSISLGVFEEAQLTGFARLRPHFPVLTPIRLDNEEKIADLLMTVKQKFADSTFDHIRVTKKLEENDFYYQFFSDQVWSKLNFILVRMEKHLK